MSATHEEKSASQQIDDIIKKQIDWRGAKLAELRQIILSADDSIVEEVKWKKPSKPEGSAVWTQYGIICVADILKNAVRLTFPKGAILPDPKKLFNARLDSATVRAIDVFQDGSVDKSALKALVLASVLDNRSTSKK